MMRALQEDRCKKHEMQEKLKQKWSVNRGMKEQERRKSKRIVFYEEKRREI